MAVLPPILLDTALQQHRAGVAGTDTIDAIYVPEGYTSSNAPPAAPVVGDFWLNTNPPGGATVAGIPPRMFARWTGAAWQLTLDYRVTDGIELNINGTGDRNAYVDFHASGLPGVGDYDYRIFRTPGVNGDTFFQQNGTGNTSYANSGGHAFSGSFMTYNGSRILEAYSAQSTAPVGPVIGDRWLNTSGSPVAGVPPSAIGTWNGTFWDFISVSSAEVFTVSATAPASPSVGDHWQNSSGSTVSGIPAGGLAIWSGAGWVLSSADASGSTPATWGSITGILSAQTDLQSALNAKVSKAGDVMSGDLGVSKAWPTLTLDKPASGTASQILGSTGGSLRWVFRIGNEGVEGGANAGSDVNFDRYSDAGAYLGRPLVIYRSTGNAYFGNNVGFGVDPPISRVDINGGLTLRSDVGGPNTSHAYTIGANPISSGVGAGGFMQFYGSTSGPGAQVLFGTSNIARFVIGPNGQWTIGGSNGVDGHFIGSNGASAPTWKPISGLLSGKKIIAIGTASHGSTISFAAEPDTAYLGLVWNGVTTNAGVGAPTIGEGSLGSKTTTSCVVNGADTSDGGGGTLLKTNPVFYVIYRN